MNRVTASAAIAVLSLLLVAFGRGRANEPAAPDLRLSIVSTTPGESVHFEGTIAVGFDVSPTMVHVAGETPFEMPMEQMVFLLLVSAETGSSIQARVYDETGTRLSAGGPRIAMGKGMPPEAEGFATSF